MINKMNLGATTFQEEDYYCETYDNSLVASGLLVLGQPPSHATHRTTCEAADRNLGSKESTFQEGTSKKGATTKEGTPKEGTPKEDPSTQAVPKETSKTSKEDTSSKEDTTSTKESTTTKKGTAKESSAQEAPNTSKAKAETETEASCPPPPPLGSPLHPPAFKEEEEEDDDTWMEGGFLGRVLVLLLCSATKA